ncbi:pseudouridylate synthase 7 homolog [Neocloeon triangulifer]|uniref:pseudouridylate synthase 7 homolog n=1 Tax=Neocloeon triangulifer TaxID=2078957 RepID=UPI00286F84CB|nr:pseudouridylate synthase 7 homolog [Neocloeon triangulifer]
MSGRFANKRKFGKFDNRNSGPSNKRPRDSGNNAPKLREIDVGVTEFVSDYPGFSGIIKQRFSDFLVNEINLENEEIHLTDKDPVVLDEPPDDLEFASLDDFTDAISKDDWEALKNLADTKSGSVEIDVSNKSKDERRQIHESIKKIYKSELTANTKDVDGRKLITVSFKTDTRRSYYKSKDRYIHFTLYKENIDTMEAVNQMSRKLGLRPGMIMYAGTKDKRAKTCQKMSLMNVKPSKILNAIKYLRGMHADGFKFCGIPLQLGMLNGNRFQIVLRNVTGSDEQIELSMKSLQEKGFLNYFGLQRFGTQSIPTFYIGRALVSGNWQEAVDLILKPRDDCEYPDMTKARQIWWEKKDASEALKQLRFKTSVEAQLWKGLQDNHKNDLVNAMESIPRNTRLLYLHSYQSYIWNKVLSKRIQEFGFKPVVGDLVLADDSKLVDTEVLEGPVSDPSDGSEAVSSTNESKLPNVIAITEENLEKYTIHDIVLPLPGFNVTYPENKTAEWFNEFFQEDGLTLDSLKQNVRKYSLGGAYRKMSILPTNVSWKIQHYDDVTEPLVLSDLDLIEKKEVKKFPDGKYKALVVDFCLPSSVYATMALREVLKVDTSSDHQKSLNPTEEKPKAEDEKTAAESTEATSPP